MMLVLNAWRKGVGQLRQQRFFIAAFVAAISCVVLAIGLLVWKLFPEVLSAQLVPLHYNIHFGIDRTGGWWQLFLPPGLSLLVTVVNFSAAASAWQRERVIAYAYTVAALLFGLIMLLGTVFVVLLNLIYA